ncbi:L-amino acid oxidase [Phlyctema vagabunda]|uniref:Amine oxidase n=1 Tax=Phlyctema vagabunda TaxID=108571 RepID=A0ABR4P1P2_9HELO
MHVGIIGGGISGLYAALLLLREGHWVTIFEAANRLGGRIYTHHFDPTAPDEDPFFEAGAMRIPRSSLHNIVFSLVRYLNTRNMREDQVTLIPYILEHNNNLAFVQGKVRERSDPGMSAQLGMPIEFHGKSADQLLSEVVRPWLDLLHADFEKGFEELLFHDDMSFRTYLRYIVKWPHEVIDHVELMTSQTNQYDLSFTEIIMQCLDFGTKEWVTIKGGMSRLVDAAANLIDDFSIHYNAPIKRIHELADGKILLMSDGPSPKTGVFDKVIAAVPPAALQGILERPQWSPRKEQAIRSIHFEPLYKIGLHFKTRFWENFPRPCFGGQSTTDLRFRWIVYPSDNIGSTGSGVLLLYSWMTDAARWATRSRQDRIDTALHDLDKFFAATASHTGADHIDVYGQFIEAFDLHWSEDVSMGDSMYLPGQFSRFFNAARQNEGNVFFAGEHLSHHHTWIAGAIDSSLYAVRTLLGRSSLDMLGCEFASYNKPKSIGKRLPAEAADLASLPVADRIGKDASTWMSLLSIPSNLNIQYVFHVS